MQVNNQSDLCMNFILRSLASILFVIPVTATRFDLVLRVSRVYCGILVVWDCHMKAL